MYEKLDPTLKSLLRIVVAIAIGLPIFLGLALLVNLLVRKPLEYQLTHQPNKSLALYNKGDYAGAYKAAWGQIALWNDSSGGLSPFSYQLGRCLLQEGKTNDALKLFQEAARSGNGYHSGFGSGNAGKWHPPNPLIEHKAQAAIAWIHQHPNWPPPPGQTPTSPGPPKDFPGA